MNTQNPPSLGTPTQDCQTFDSTVMVSGPINHVGYFRFYPRESVAVNNNYGYYYAIDTTADFKPMPLENYEGSNSCSSSYYYVCLSFPDINYFVIWVKSSADYYVNMYVNFGAAISQVSTYMKVKEWNQGRYVALRTITISPTCWNQIRSAPTSFSAATTTG